MCPGDVEGRKEKKKTQHQLQHVLWSEWKEQKENTSKGSKLHILILLAVSLMVQICPSFAGKSIHTSLAPLPYALSSSYEFNQLDLIYIR